MSETLSGVLPIRVQTLVGSETRERLVAAVATLGGIDSFAHCDSRRELYRDFPHQNCCVLVAEWSLMFAAKASSRAVTAVLGFVDQLSGWDGVLLLLDEPPGAELIALLSSRLAPRLVTAPASLVDRGAEMWVFAAELSRVMSAARVLPPSRALVQTGYMICLLSLPNKWHVVVNQALRNPQFWPMKKVCAALRVDRSTLDRAFRKRMLPTLAALCRSDMHRKS